MTIVLDRASSTDWQVWTMTARLVMTDARALPEARSLVEEYVSKVDMAASRFRPDSEVRTVASGRSNRPVPISPLLTELVNIALDAARATRGAVDPTVGNALVRLGYGERFESPAAGSPGPSLTRQHRVSWRDVQLERGLLTVPRGLLLDLGATAKAHVVDHCAELLAARFGGGVLMSIGGDLRACGEGPAQGWNVLVQDGQSEPASYVRLHGSVAVTTSSTLKRTWQSGLERLHHIVDPTSWRSAAPVWRTVSVAAPTCLAANTWSTAAIVRGARAVEQLDATGFAARLVASDGSVRHIGGWPT